MTDRDKILAATVYADEAQLLSWSETDKGRKVTLMLSPHAGEQHPFRELRPGRRLMLAATLIGDDEQPERAKTPVLKQAPAEPAQRREEPTAETKRRFKDLPKSQQCALKLQDFDFRGWLVDTYWTGKEEVGDYDALLKRVLVIASKRDLDTNKANGAAWDAMCADFDTRSYQR